MKKLDYYAWHAFDYAADTSHLSRESDYAFRRLLDEIFRTNQVTCRIKDDDEYLRSVARATPEEWKKIRRELIDGAKPLFLKSRGWISNARLTSEIRLAQRKSSQNSRNAKHGKSQDDGIATVERPPSDRSRSARQSNKKKKSKKKKPAVSSKKGTSTEVPSAAAVELRRALRAAGMKIGRPAEQLTALWAESPGTAAVLLLLADNLANVQAADHALQYFARIVKNAAKESPKIQSGEVSLDPTPDDTAAVRAFQAERERKIRQTKWDDCRELGAQWLETHGGLPPGKWSAAHNAFYHAVGVAPADYAKMRDEFAVAARQSA